MKVSVLLRYAPHYGIIMHTFNQAWSAVTFQNLFKCKLEATKLQGHSLTDSSFFRAFWMVNWSLNLTVI